MGRCERNQRLELGRHLDAVRDALAAAGMDEDAVLVDNATLPDFYRVDYVRMWQYEASP